MRKLTVDDIEIPEGMLEAVNAYAVLSRSITSVVKHALLWATEHPRVPTEEERGRMVQSQPKDGRTYIEYASVEWQRRMWLKKEPESPSELEELVSKSKYVSDGLDILTAFRIGLDYGKRSKE